MAMALAMAIANGEWRAPARRAACFGGSGAYAIRALPDLCLGIGSGRLERLRSGAFFNSASRLLRRQLVRQLRPQLFDHLAHLVRDNADVFNIEHVLEGALDRLAS